MSLPLNQLRRHSFVLWTPTPPPPDHPPALVLALALPTSPVSLGLPISSVPGAPLAQAAVSHRQLPRIPLRPSERGELWSVPAAELGLTPGALLAYWFVVPVRARDWQPLWITDPFACTVDYRLRANKHLGDPNLLYPASVVRWTGEELAVADLGDSALPCDSEDATQAWPAGAEGNTQKEAWLWDQPTLRGEQHPGPQLSPNSKLLIYELPPAWAQSQNREQGSTAMVGVGSFRDITSLVDDHSAPPNHPNLSDLFGTGTKYLVDLGITALELLPPADSTYNRQWGYGPTNFCAPDYELGLAEDYAFSAANRDLARLVKILHSRGIRFFVDSVLAFSKSHPYEPLLFDDFFINPAAAPDSDPDKFSSRGNGEWRNGWGAASLRYGRALPDHYDPLTGRRGDVYPARSLVLAALARWMEAFQVDGLRLDSIENVANWDLLKQYALLGRQMHCERFPSDAAGANPNAYFLTVGEELSVPGQIVQRGVLDGLWNERFKQFIRCALLGRNHSSEPSFEWTVRKAIDCRCMDLCDGCHFSDMTQAVIYLTSHDVEGPGNERLFSALRLYECLPYGAALRRMGLGFACLLTAVGTPMILAGDEFGDEHALFGARHTAQGTTYGVSQEGGKQVDPVHWDHLREAPRQRLMQYVSRLAYLRTRHPALAVNDTLFFWADFNEGKRVLAWRRGTEATGYVAVLANFSDWGTASPLTPGAEYLVSSWPAGAHVWYAVSELDVEAPAPPAGARQVPRPGTEPLFPWEAKVYFTLPANAPEFSLDALVNKHHH